MANSWEMLVDQVIALQEEPGFDAAAPPAVQWYFSQWYSDDVVMMMGWAARGVHHHLLGVAWRQRPPCSLPNDQRKLSALCHHPAGWDEIWLEVQEAWRERGGRLWQVGLVKGYLSAMVVRRSRSASSRKRWKTKAARANAVQMHKSRTPMVPTVAFRVPENDLENEAENGAETTCKSLSLEPLDANAQKSDTSSSSSSSSKEEAIPESTTPAAKPPADAPAKKLTAQQKVVERAWGIYDRFDARRPLPGVIGSWLKVFNGDAERLCRLLEDEGPRGCLSKGEGYIFRAVQSEAAGNGRQVSLPGSSRHVPLPVASAEATENILRRAIEKSKGVKPP